MLLLRACSLELLNERDGEVEEEIVVPPEDLDRREETEDLFRDLLLPLLLFVLPLLLLIPLLPVLTLAPTVLFESVKFKCEAEDCNTFCVFSLSLLSIPLLDGLDCICRWNDWGGEGVGGGEGNKEKEAKICVYKVELQMREGLGEITVGAKVQKNVGARFYCVMKGITLSEMSAARLLIPISATVDGLSLLISLTFRADATTEL